jgi:hypothetical protein
LYSSEGNKDEERLRFLQHLVIKQKEAARDEDYLAKYHDESMLGLNQGGLTLVSKLALSWATNMLQTVRKSFTMETMRVQNKDALNVAMKNVPSSGMEASAGKKRIIFANNLLSKSIIVGLVWL